MLVSKIKPCMCVHRFTRPFCRRCAPGLNWPGRASGAVTLKKLECSKQAYALYTLAWDNIIGFRPITLAFGIGVMINRDSRGHSYFIVRGEILGFMKERTTAKAFAKDVFINQERKLGGSKTIRYRPSLNHKTMPTRDQRMLPFRTPLAPYEKSKFLGSGGSMGRKAET
ncbi:hypothetical protein L1887_57627 [Cichorium endivia]|nr:hypothetical protein L1887_57627 [Cichorium endivia]